MLTAPPVPTFSQISIMFIISSFRQIYIYI